MAADYWALKRIFYPIDWNERHHPDFPGIDYWLAEARDIINRRGGLYNPDQVIFIERTTKNETEMIVHEQSASTFIREKLSKQAEDAHFKKRYIIK